LPPGQPEPQPIEILGGRFLPGKGLYVLELEGIEDREQAETLRDCQLLVKKSDRPHLEEDEFYTFDLIGLEVINQLDGQNLGTVVDVINAGHDVLEIEK
ncbi:MAG: 16S rRNA processing protein RimM, partial [Okeania sp. SIO2H7]|nr:16S rRNA processing protein RimM [Okeania sp. SIO2H7]